MGLPTITDDILVAYVDGELADEERLKVEIAVATDPKLLRKLDDYEKSAILLKNAISVENEKTPAYIGARIQAIEARAEKNAEKTQVDSSSTKILSYFSWRFLASIGASFAAGLALFPLVLAPALISIRGIPSNDGLFLDAQLIQNNSTIYDGGTISPNIPFNLTIMTPVNGIVNLVEIIGDSQELIYSAQILEAGRFFTFPAMQVEGQTELTFRLELSNDSTNISHIMNFRVLQN